MTNYVILALCVIVILSYIFDISGRYSKIPGVISAYPPGNWPPDDRQAIEYEDSKPAANFAGDRDNWSDTDRSGGKP